jgi:hypothetical protein
MSTTTPPSHASPPWGRRVTTVVDEWLILDTRRRVPVWRLLLYTAIAMSIAWWAVPGVVTERIPFTSDGHAMASYDSAVTRALCGLPSRYNPVHHPGYFMAHNGWASDLPAPALLATVAGSVQTYCSTATVPYVNLDNSLGLLETVCLLLKPTASAVEIERFLAVVRVAIVAAFIVLLMSLGASVLFGAAVAVASLAICSDLQHSVMAYSTYPFFFAMVLLNVIAFSGALRIARSGRLATTLLAACAVGFIVAASVNMRASYLPIYACFFVAYASGVWRTRPRGLTLPLLVPAFVIGYFLFQYPLITRPARVPADSNYTYHTVSHPLVLGLALPESALSKREGITWSDEVGNSLARRIDPATSYLGPGYEKAMFAYYRSLWKRYPAEMVGVYIEKAQLAGADMIQHSARDAGWMPAAIWPLSGIHNGFYFGAMLLVLTAVALAISWNRGGGFAFCVALLGLAGVLVYVESAIIVPLYFPQYQNYLLFVALFVSFLFYQLVVNAAVGGVKWLIHARHATGNAT